jgi:hypothetical protein
VVIPSRTIRAGVLGAFATSLLAQEEPAPASPPPAPGYQRVQGTFFQIDLPEGWRQLLPNEVATVRNSVPWALRQVVPGRLMVFGEIDAWLAGRFDGRALVVFLDTLEQPVDEVHLAELVERWRDWRSPEGDRREVLSAEVTTVGRNDHPALCLALRTTQGDGGPDIRALDFHTSTSGRQLILSFRAWENDWVVAEPEIRREAGTLTFPRPPREPEELGDRLWQAAIVGGLVAVLLVAIRQLRTAMRTPN